VPSVQRAEEAVCCVQGGLLSCMLFRCSSSKHLLHVHVQVTLLGNMGKGASSKEGTLFPVVQEPVNRNANSLATRKARKEELQSGCASAQAHCTHVSNAWRLLQARWSGLSGAVKLQM
jgi:hypothetical protein